MATPIRDPDELSHEKDTPANNYHDEDQEIQNDDAPGQRPQSTAHPRKSTRRPPPKKCFNED